MKTIIYSIIAWGLDNCFLSELSTLNNTGFFSYSVHSSSKTVVLLSVHLSSTCTSVFGLGKSRVQKHKQKEGFAYNFYLCLLQK